MEKALKILKGTIISYGIIIVMLFIYATILVKTNIGENYMREIILFILVISNTLATIIECKKINKNGMLIGGSISLASMILMYITSSICYTNFSMTKYSFLIVFICILGGIIGGIIGVNLHKEKKAKY